MSLQPVEPIILDDIIDTFTFAATCTAFGIPRPVITWLSVTAGNESRVLDASELFISINSTDTVDTAVSIVTVRDLNVSESGSSIICFASNAVSTISASQTPFLAGKWWLTVHML